MLHWFPGHMHKATKEFKKKINQIDIAIEIVDSRIPYSGQNHVLEEIVGDKPIIRILSKADLSDPATTKKWIKYYQNNAIAINTIQDKDTIKKIINLAKRQLPNRGTILKPIRAVIFGIPNVGKSTMINKLAGRSIAKTGNEPAVTKIQQRIEITKGFHIFDTPGIMFPKPKTENCGYKIACIGSIRDTAMDYIQTAEYLINFLLKTNNQKFKQRYAVNDDSLNSLEILENISKIKNKSLIQVSKLVVHDFRNGTLGRISLESPEDIDSEDF